MQRELIAKRLTESPELSARVPSLILADIAGYALDRTDPGGFLRAVLANDLSEALGRCCEQYQPALRDIVAYVANCLPASCVGSHQVVRRWLQGGG